MARKPLRTVIPHGDESKALQHQIGMANGRANAAYHALRSAMDSYQSTPTDDERAHGLALGIERLKESLAYAEAAEAESARLVAKHSARRA